jgi:hypothetical protein
MSASKDPAPQKSDEVSSDEEPLSRTSSQSAASVSDASYLPLTTLFTPTKSFFVHAHGLSSFHLVLPRQDTSIKITDSSGATVFTSERPSRWSATTSLHSASGETLGEMTGDRFSNLPLRVIDIRLLGADGPEVVKIKRKGTATRACVFDYGGWEWKWRYGRHKEGAKTNGHTLLVLQRKQKGGDEKEVVARLWRDHDADKEGGTKPTDAGRGGRLELGFAEEERNVEVLVIMSCLVMLKKEIDRRRAARGLPVVTMWSSKKSA